MSGEGGARCLVARAGPAGSPVYDRLVYLAAASAVVAGVANLIGWAYQFEPALSIYPGLPRMVPNTALGVIVAGVAIPLAASQQRLARWTGKLLAIVLLIFSTMTLLEYIAGWDLGIDH